MQDCFKVDTDVVTIVVLLAFLVFLDVKHPFLLTGSNSLFPGKILSPRSLLINSSVYLRRQQWVIVHTVVN